MTTDSDEGQSPNVAFSVSRTIEADSPAFSGHFPGDPIFPGVAQLLELVAGPLEAHLQTADHPKSSKRIACIKQTKFLQPVRPGMTLEVRFAEHPSLEHTWRFRITNPSAPESQALITHGTLVVSDQKMSRVSVAPKLPTISELGPLERAIPHRGAMLWLDRAYMISRDEIQTEKFVRGTEIYFDKDSGWPSYCALELLAQTAAADFGYRNPPSAEAPKGGALLSCRHLDLFEAWIPRKTNIDIITKRTFEMPPMARFEGSVIADGWLIAQGTIDVALI